MQCSCHFRNCTTQTSDGICFDLRTYRPNRCVCFSGNRAQPMQGNYMTSARKRRGAVQLHTPGAAEPGLPTPLPSQVAIAGKQLALGARPCLVGGSEGAARQTVQRRVNTPRSSPGCVIKCTRDGRKNGAGVLVVVGAGVEPLTWRACGATARATWGSLPRNVTLWSPGKELGQNV